MIGQESDDRVNILLVDDQPQRLLSFQSALQDLGQNVMTARSGVQALQLLMQHEFAVVLLDISMPGMDGFETAAMIHDHPRYERTPIIFVTGVHDTDMDRLTGYKLGAVDYVAIPVVPEILRSKVAVLVELHCQRRKLQDLNRSLAQANSRLESAHADLQAEKHQQLEALNESLQLANKELERANRALQGEIGERSRAETALKAADRHKDEFIAILAHELRNPLAPIRSALQIMTQATLEDERLAWSRDVIQRQVIHLTRLVDDLLDISRITRGTINLSKEPIAISALLARSLEAVNPLITERCHGLEIDCEDDSVVLEGDATRLVQVLSNLLGNAAKYTPPNGRIQLAVHKRDEDVEFRIRDNGIGIPTEALTKVFTLFSRLPEPGENQQDGLGIGLALAKQLVELHGGAINVHSAGVDKGSEFVVRLPIVSTSPVLLRQPARVLDIVPLPATANAHFRVLVADDNSDALDTLSLLLEMAGHDVLKASTGPAALQLALAEQPDVALLDIGMPGLNGYEVAKRIRAASGQHMVLVAVSGWGQSDDKRRSTDAGFNLHLVKPVDFEAVEKLLAQCAVQSNNGQDIGAKSTEPYLPQADGSSPGRSMTSGEDFAA
jgi:signal transduction histidine kinase